MYDTVNKLLLKKFIAMLRVFSQFYFVTYLGYVQESSGCYKDRETFLAELNPEDYFQDEDEITNIVKKQ